MTKAMRTDPVVVCSRLTAEGVIPPPGAVVISITNPSQSPARLQDGWAAVLRLKFHDTERPMGNFQLMNRADALAILDFVRTHPHVPILVHCEYGASRSVAVGLFLAVWLRRRLQLPYDVLTPNKWVLHQLRLAGIWRGLRWRDIPLVTTALGSFRKRVFEVLPPDVASTL